MSVSGHEQRADDAFGINQGEPLDGLCGRDLVQLEAEAPRGRRHALQLAPAGGRGGEPQRSDGFPLDRLPRLGLEAAVELGRILHHAREVALAPQLADEARRVPRTAVRQAALLEQQHVALAGPGEMEGDRATDGPPADDDDAGLGWKAHAFASLISPRYQSRNWATFFSLSRESGPGS